ncbi:MAG: hypothetical protein NUV69_05770 [Candidatus Curtissbacteria bacterium]|nr:hypothetical protein [Candidatus Curtissbacteria bacterium]
MKWVIFTGTWRLTNKEVENDVRVAVRKVLARGDGVVTGGATGVDYFAMTEALLIDPSILRLKVIIPTDLTNYISDYRKNWNKFPVTEESINELEKVLKQIKELRKEHLIEMPPKYDITQDHYDLRHNEEVAISDEVCAFQVNNSTGTQDTINKARSAGLKIALYKKYDIKE